MSTATKTNKATDRLQIDFLYLDLDSCTRCRGTDASLESALAAVGDELAANGTEVDVSRIHVESADQARALRFVSSPTLRVNGRDIALELRESSCGSEACADGCGESIACRVWVHEGREYTQAPVALVVEAILGEVEGATIQLDETEPVPYELPENLVRFFAGTAAAEAKAALADEPTPVDCCSAADQRSCCAAEDKAECCGAGTGGSCGCR